MAKIANNNKVKRDYFERRCRLFQLQVITVIQQGGGRTHTCGHSRLPSVVFTIYHPQARPIPQRTWYGIEKGRNDTKWYPNSHQHASEKIQYVIRPPPPLAHRLYLTGPSFLTPISPNVMSPWARLGARGSSVLGITNTRPRSVTIFHLQEI